MFTLHVPRIIQSTPVTHTYQCSTLAECMQTLIGLYSTSAWVIGPDGERYDLVDYDDPDDHDYIIQKFERVN